MLNTITFINDNSILTAECVAMENANENRLRLEFELKNANNPLVTLEMGEEKQETILSDEKTIVEVPEMWLLNGNEFHMIYAEEEVSTDILFVISEERSGDMIVREEVQNYCVIFNGKTKSNNVECYGTLKININGAIIEGMGGIVS